VIPREVAERARELHQRRRTNAGRRFKPWAQVADEIRAEGLGKWPPADLADAVRRLPIEGHELAPNPAEYSKLEKGWREGWAAEFPGEDWPGLEEARRRIRQKNTEAAKAPALEH